MGNFYCVVINDIKYMQANITNYGMGVTTKLQFVSS